MPAATRHIPAAAILAPVGLLMLPLSTVQPLWIAILAAAAALGALAASVLDRRWPATAGWLPWLLAAIVVWGAASAIWSVDPERSLHQAARLALIAIGALFLLTQVRDLDDANRARIGTFVLTGTAAGICFIAFEVLTGGAFHGALNDFEEDPVKNLFHLNRASSVAAIIVWVALIPLWRRQGPALAIGAVVVVFLALQRLQPDTSLLAMIAGGGFFVIGWAAPRIAAALLAGGLILFTAAAPFLSRISDWATASLTQMGLAEFSLSHRLAIWDFASERAALRPLFGWGLDTSRSIGSGAVVGVKDSPELSARAADALPLHPHNAVLQIWLELGLTGTVLVIALFAFAVWAIATRIREPLGRAAAFAMTASALVIAQLSFGIWQGWWLSCLWLCSLLLLALVDWRREPRAGA